MADTSVVTKAALKAVRSVDRWADTLVVNSVENSAVRMAGALADL